MNVPDMHNDPLVLLALAALVWLLFAVQTYRRRPKPRKPEQSDSPKADEYRNRWH
ncbi:MULTISPECIES: hypothetical protein [unclassified Curtobacterium]|uniref:hypothetical protein n=1 Tax=unclassified Curtobacterium TaxID=257496 RepID=UPI003A80D14A